MHFQMKWKSSTLDDLEDHWQPVWSAIVATAGLLVNFSLMHQRSRYLLVTAIPGLNSQSGIEKFVIQDLVLGLDLQTGRYFDIPNRHIYLRQGGYVFAGFCLFVCVCSYERIFLKFWGYVGHGIN